MRISFTYEVKPSAQLSKCERCGKEILKGDKRIAVRGDAYRASSLSSYHPDCFKKEIDLLMSVGVGNSMNM